MDGRSLNITEEKLEKLKEILPEAFTENKIDWEKLKAALGENIEFKNERYVLNWAGKSDAFRVLQSPTTATLVPAKEESVNFDTTENIFIEGENLEVLKVLQKAYFGKIKMIYIDPPYNTGNDNFIYPDKFSESREEYLSRIGDKDETGYLTREGLFRKNSKDSGHYHSNWLSMMYPRLFLARNLLKDDGVIFVSIDDNEVHNLRLLMNEVFGEENFIATFPWRKRTAKSDVPFGISQDYEWILAFTRNNFEAGRIFDREYYKSDDFKERWRLSDLTTQRSKEERPNSFFDLINPRDKKKYPANPKRVWGITKDTVANYLDKGKIVFPGDYKFLNISKPAYRVFESEDRKKNFDKFGSEDTRIPISTMLPKNIGRTEDGTKEIDELFNQKIFPFPKPSSLIKYFINTDINNDGIILDFFAGSATTAHAVLDLNKEDGGNRKFILVQLPEKTDEKSEAYKAGYKTIAEIGKERIRRVIKRIEEELAEKLDLEGNAENLDLGFKVFKLKESNFKIWRTKIETEEELVEQLQRHLEPLDETAKTEDVLYELLLKSGVQLTAKIEKKSGFYLVNNTEIALILDNVDKKIIKAVIDTKPQKAITLDRLFRNNDQLKTNTALQMKDAGIEFKVV